MEMAPAFLCLGVAFPSGVHDSFAAEDWGGRVVVGRGKGKSGERRAKTKIAESEDWIGVMVHVHGRPRKTAMRRCGPPGFPCRS